MLSVLITDDDIYVTKSLRVLIDWRALGYNVVMDAQNGEEALSLYNQHNFDVVITDIRMPIMDGVDFCRKIRETNSETIIIFLSAYEDFETVRMAIQYNVTDYISKPMNAEKVKALSRTLEKIAENYQMRYYFKNMRSDADVENEIITKLRQNDTDYFSALFDQFANCTAVDYAVILDLCGKLIVILYKYLEKIGFSIESTRERRDAKIKELADFKRKNDMVTYVSIMYFDTLNLFTPNKDGYFAITMEKVRDYVFAHYTDTDLSVSLIANEFGYTADYLTRLFSRYTGETIGAFITDFRLGKAAYLLQRSDVTINDLTVMVGYSSSNYFAKAFKKAYGATPSEYRINFLAAKKGEANENTQ